MTDTNKKISELRKVIKIVKDAQQRRRYNTVLLYYRGYTQVHIADIFDLTEQIVGVNIARYKDSDFEGLKLKKSPGRTKKLTDEQEAGLYTIIETKTPNEVGFEPFINWTVTELFQLTYRSNIY